ncbi:restriction endonuclease subunit S [Streptomyces collinus]|uniref:restriction endonuclease subunit S n=1 Tax=Streptomyces collinus TaxID=42684 RepID=UPI0036D04036
MLIHEPTNWEDVTFGEVVRNVTTNSQDASRSVGLEHLDGSALSVNKWSEGKESTFKRRFSHGHTLFGKRRAYQRKSGYADFDGVCSSDILVFEARPGRLLPTYLPLIVRSETFHRLALETSAGSLSPRTSWKSLASYAFKLPPLAEQQRIVDLMWAFERSAQAKQIALDEARQAELSALAELYDEPSWPKRRVDKAGEVQLGMKREPSVHSGQHLRPYLRVANVGDDELNLDDVLEMNFNEAHFEKYQLRPGDILLNEGQSLEYVGRSAMFRGEIDGCCFQMTLVRFRSGAEILPAFAHGWFRRCLHVGDFARVAKRTTSIAHLPAGLLSAQLIPVPSMPEQERVVARLAAARELRLTLKRGLQETRTLMWRTLNALLDGQHG